MEKQLPFDKILQAVLKCKTDLLCYKDELGEPAEACARKCIKSEQESEATLLAEKNRFKGIWDKVKCLFNCLKSTVPLEKILQVVLKCKTDVNCYLNELGEAGQQCAGQCLKKGGAAPAVITDSPAITEMPTKEEKLEGSYNKLKGAYAQSQCLFKVMNSRVPLQKIVQVVLKCNSEFECYGKELGPDGASFAKVCF